MGRPKKELPKHSSGMYEYKATVGHTFQGRAIRKSFYSSKSKADAKAKSEEYIVASKVAEQTGQDMRPYCSASMGFEKQAQITLQLKKSKVRQNTYELHWRNVVDKHLLPYFGNAKISEIRKNDIEFYLQSKGDLAKATLKSHLNVLNAIFENAVDNDIISKNPCHNIKIEYGKQTAEKRTYTAEQATLILDFCKSHRFGLEIDLLLRYGLSRSELLGILREDVDLDGKTIIIRQGVTNGQGAGNKRVVISETKNKYRARVIAISDETATLIRKRDEAIKGKRNPAFLIFNKFGDVCSPDTWYRRHYQEFMKDMHKHFLNQTPSVDVPMLNPHELRHTRASIWVNDGKNLFAIADQMGWSDLDMLRKRYAHGDISQLRKQLDL